MTRTKVFKAIVYRGVELTFYSVFLAKHSKCWRANHAEGGKGPEVEWGGMYDGYSDNEGAWKKYSWEEVIVEAKRAVDEEILPLSIDKDRKQRVEIGLQDAREMLETLIGVLPESQARTMCDRLLAHKLGDELPPYCWNEALGWQLCNEGYSDLLKARKYVDAAGEVISEIYRTHARNID